MITLLLEFGFGSHDSFRPGTSLRSDFPAEIDIAVRCPVSSTNQTDSPFGRRVHEQGIRYLHPLDSFLAKDSLVIPVVDLIEDTMVHNECAAGGGLILSEPVVIHCPLGDSMKDCILKDHHLGVVETFLLFFLCQSKAAIAVMDIAVAYDDRVSEGIWMDSDGNNLIYTNWLSGEPNNDFNAEHTRKIPSIF